jgi:hypothetical protein
MATKKKTKGYKVKGKLGTGSRFKRLANTLKRKGVNHPEALAAKIGRSKFGKKKFQKLASKGRKKK